MLQISGEDGTNRIAKNVADSGKNSGLFTKDPQFQALIESFLSLLGWELQEGEEIENFFHKKSSVGKFFEYSTAGPIASLKKLVKQTAEEKKILKDLARHTRSDDSDGNWTPNKICEIMAEKYASLRRVELKKALNFCNNCLAMAPEKALKVAFVLRADIFFHLEDYHFCKLDVNRAMMEFSSSPEETKKPVLTENEKKQIIFKWARYSSLWMSKSRFRKIMIECESEPDCPQRMRELSLSQELDEMLKRDDAEIDYVKEDNLWLRKLWIVSDRCGYEKNPAIPHVSKKVKIERNEKYGRHWVAAEDIEPGEVLSVEECFAAVLYPESSDYCSYCGIWCPALNPCRTCSVEMYCSERCREKAKLAYHEVECRILSYVNLNDQTSLLALRIFLIGINQNLETLKRYQEENSDVEESSSPDKEKMSTSSFSDDYPTIIDLSQKFKNEKALSNLSEDRIRDAVSFVVALKRINFFESSDSKKLSTLELFAAILLLHHTALLPFDRINIKAQYINKKRELKRKKIAIALPRVQALLNHSCNPQANVITQNRHQMVFTVRPIKKGEQIFASYCDDYGNATIKKREEELKSFGILNCKCKPCIEKWPRYKGSSLNYSDNKFVTSDPDILETIEKVHNELKTLVEDNAIKHEYNDYMLDEAIEQAKTIREHLQEPSPTIWICEELIRRCMLSRTNYISVSRAASVGNVEQASREAPTGL